MSKCRRWDPPIFAWFCANLGPSGCGVDTFWTLLRSRAHDRIKLSTRNSTRAFIKPTVFVDGKTVALIASRLEKSYDILDVFDFGEVGERLKPTVC